MLFHSFLKFKDSTSSTIKEWLGLRDSTVGRELALHVAGTIYDPLSIARCGKTHVHKINLKIVGEGS